MNRKILASLIVVLSGFLLYSSCTKVDATDLGKDLIPAVDNVHTFETLLDVETDNFLYPDTTVVYASFPHALGVIDDDPEFGKTQAAIYASLTPNVYGAHPFLEKDSVLIDSVVLSLAYNNLYGDSNSVQQIEVFEIDPASNNFKDSAYRISTPAFAVLPGVLGQKNLVFNTLNDSISYVNNRTDTILSNNELRIHLDTAWARHFVNYDTADVYKTDSAFRTHFKGLALRVNEAASAGKRALAYFDLTNTSKTRLTFYVRVTSNGSVDTLSSIFNYTGATQANLVSHTPAHNYQAYLENGNANDDKVYLQSAPGSYVTVKIPGLDTLKNTNRVIHRAELVVEPIASTLDNIYTPMPTLFIDALSAAGDSVFTIRNDFVFTGSGQTMYDLASLGGYYRAGKYTFNLTRYLQSVVSKQLPYHTLRISAPLYMKPWWQLADGSKTTLPTTIYVNEPIAYGRVVAGGGSHPTNKMRMRIIYSKI
ncbi:MAG: DUF4270 family protein [Candidatus Pseudobacter hemicellulosilyticus]|uniref:DUF4270 family protein n=1 Tax=Candidatus Pseudobacter hemicellulosilyticus TaxID=3121375 RepID=A0AAJ5WUR6_9BACT|nr:MAG: DUF4270 family protein [Pseudobacter sp.]